MKLTYLICLLSVLTTFANAQETNEERSIDFFISIGFENHYLKDMEKSVGLETITVNPIRFRSGPRISKGLWIHEPGLSMDLIVDLGDLFLGFGAESTSLYRVDSKIKTIGINAGLSYNWDLLYEMMGTGFIFKMGPVFGGSFRVSPQFFFGNYYYDSPYMGGGIRLSYTIDSFKGKFFNR